jgi:hypothetical protein
MPRLTNRILMAVLGVAVSASLVLGVAAWFAGYWKGDDSLIFAPGSNGAVPLAQVWTYISGAEATDTQPEGWINLSDASSSDGTSPADGVSLGSAKPTG